MVENGDGARSAQVSRALPAVPWTANEAETDAVTLDELVAAPGAGKRLVITDILVTNSATSAITWTLIEDTGGAATPKWGPHQIPASGGFAFRFDTPIVIAEDKNIGLTTTGTSEYCTSLSGYTEDV
jgi:hypothetical protein